LPANSVEFRLAAAVEEAILWTDIAGMVAAMTESELGLESERTSDPALLSAVALAKEDG